LRTWFMKPFSKRHKTLNERIFNYSMSRARRKVENAFGILAHRFLCLLTTLRQKPETVISIVLACVCLHNLLRLRNPREQNAYVNQEDQQHNVIPGAWRDDFSLLDAMNNVRGGNRLTKAAKYQREYISAYYNSARGSVPWQRDMI